MARREYQSGQPTTLLNPLNIGGNTFTISLTDPTLLAGWPDGAEGYNFWVTVDAGKPQEERILCASRSGSVVTVAASGRGSDGTTESNHAAGAEIWPSWSATDADEANAHVNATTNVHGVTGTIAPAESPTFTGTVVLPSTTSIGSVSSTEIGYLDGVTSSIQTQINTINTSLTNNTPIGTIVMYGAAIAPTNWLLCNGQSTASYPALAAVVGANVPDLMGRTPVGYGSGAGLTARTTLGAKFGAETHVLSVNEMPSHNHPFDAGDGLGNTNRTHFMDRNASHGHGMDGVGDHSHSITSKWSGSQTHDHAGPGSVGYVSSGSDQSGGTETQTNTNGGGAHSHGIHGTDINHRHTIQAEGGGAAHNNMQPSTVVNFIIKAA